MLLKYYKKGELPVYIKESKGYKFFVNDSPCTILDGSVGPVGLCVWFALNIHGCLL